MHFLTSLLAVLPFLAVWLPLSNMNKSIARAEVLVLGASYRQNVGDTRYSGSELIIRKLAEMGAELRVHDPFVNHWWEFETQETYPSASHSKARFFRNQDRLKDIKMLKDLQKSFNGVSAVVFAVKHADYLDLNPDDVVKWIGQPVAIIGCFGILSDTQIKKFFELGCEVKALGRGHIQNIKDDVRRKLN